MRIICLILLMLSAHAFASDKKKPFTIKRAENIQVLIEKDVSGAILEATGPYQIFNPENGSKISTGLFKKKFFVHGQSNGLKWGEVFPGVHQIYLIPTSSESSFLVNGIQYDGAIAIYHIDNKINIINDIDIERYIKSILALKFPYPLESEVMAAIAILARTDAYYQVSKGLSSFWNVEAKKVSYQGSALVDSNSFISKSVDSTKNLILVHPHNGKNAPFAAQWTDHSAGKTVSFQSMFRFDGNAPHFSVPAPHAALDRDETRWSYSVSKLKLSELLNLAQIDKIELFMDEDSNKAYAIRVTGPNTKHDYTFFEFQERLGSEHLKSSEFTVENKKDYITFTGFGKGHGVGMCLYSASSLAENGENAVQILSKFFPETYLMNLSALPNRHGNIVENLNEGALFNQ